MTHTTIDDDFIQTKHKFIQIVNGSIDEKLTIFCSHASTSANIFKNGNRRERHGALVDVFTIIYFYGRLFLAIRFLTF